ncbi:indoleamine 2,3-dioxygenase 2-like [Diadema antillarum]|uniref:indoleamine 2,3-dioxygenase 2-like n=1 Tax=Diadema antillarum TaxID=105358 RepID=UPI003A8A7FA9
METIVNICGLPDESWFFSVINQIEIHFAPAIFSLVESMKAVVDKDIEKLIRELRVIREALDKMGHTLGRMTEECSTRAFYDFIRPFTSGSDSPAFKRRNLQGLIYEGVSDQPVRLAGGSGAQSVILPCLDAGFGIAKSQSHAQSCGSSDALASFNGCLDAISNFRTCHLKIVGRYLVAMSRKGDIKLEKDAFSKHDRPSNGPPGFLKYLSGLRIATVRAKLADENCMKIGKDMVSMATVDGLRWGMRLKKFANTPGWRTRRSLAITILLVTIVVLMVLN